MDRFRVRRRALIWSAVFFVALRALIPVGFMLSFGSAGAAVTLCPQYGAVGSAPAQAPAPVHALHADDAAAPEHQHHPGQHGHGLHDHGDEAAQAGDHAPAPATPAGHDHSTSADVADSHGICPFAAAAHLTWHAPDGARPIALPDGATVGVASPAQVLTANLLFYTSRSPRSPPALNPA